MKITYGPLEEKIWKKASVFRSNTPPKKPSSITNHRVITSSISSRDLKSNPAVLDIKRVKERGSQTMRPSNRNSAKYTVSKNEWKEEEKGTEETKPNLSSSSYF